MSEDYRKKQPKVGSLPPSGIAIPPRPTKETGKTVAKEENKPRKKVDKRWKIVATLAKVIIFTASLLCLLCIFGVVGGFGESVGTALKGVFGATSVAVFLFICVFSGVSIFGIKPKRANAKVLGITIALTAIALLVLQIATSVNIYNSLADKSFSSYLSACYKQGFMVSGGWLGGVFAYVFLNWIGSITSMIILCVAIFAIIFISLLPYMLKDKPKTKEEVVEEKRDSYGLFVEDFEPAKKGKERKTSKQSKGDEYNIFDHEERRRVVKVEEESVGKSIFAGDLPIDYESGASKERKTPSILEMDEEEFLRRFAKAEGEIVEEVYTPFASDEVFEREVPEEEEEIDLKEDLYVDDTPAESKVFPTSVITPEEADTMTPSIDDTDFTKLSGPIFPKREKPQRDIPVVSYEDKRETSTVVAIEEKPAVVPVVSETAPTLEEEEDEDSIFVSPIDDEEEIPAVEEEVIIEEDPVVEEIKIDEEPVVEKTVEVIKEEPNPIVEVVDEHKPEEIPHQYVKPPLYLLKDYDRVSNEDDCQKIGERVVQALASFDVHIELIKFQTGPTFTLYLFRLGEGVSIKRVLSYELDIKRMLMTDSEINIIESVGNMDAFGIEVLNKKRSVVGLKTMLTDPCYQKPNQLNFAIGEDVQGNKVYGDILSMPHLLVAGSTNTGKSVCLNALICSILYNYSPDDVKFIMIDPKLVELKLYNEIPHMILKSTVTDVKQAVNALGWAVKEMKRRYEVFADESVRNIASYNSLMDEMGKKRMPYIIIIIDEMANLMMENRREVEDNVSTLTSLSRAAGIHLITATQRPSVDVITGTIKNNIPTRIGFKVAGSADSKTIMDKGGAEKLYGKGDMFYINTAIKSEPMRLQGPLIDEREVRDVVNFIKEHNPFVYDEKASDEIFAVPKPETSIDTRNAMPENGDEDIFVDALKYVVDNQSVSITKLQRVFKLGYARAARLVDVMEERGFVTPQDATKNRKVLLSADQFAQLMKEGGIILSADDE